MSYPSDCGGGTGLIDAFGPVRDVVEAGVREFCNALMTRGRYLITSVSANAHGNETERRTGRHIVSRHYKPAALHLTPDHVRLAAVQK